MNSNHQAYRDLPVDSKKMIPFTTKWTNWALELAETTSGLTHKIWQFYRLFRCYGASKTTWPAGEICEIKYILVTKDNRIF